MNAKESILGIGGFRIGHAHDTDVKTGVTVILPDSPALCSVDVRGGGPGTREIAALADGGLIERVHAIVLSGGSVYGLAAADGVTAWLGAQRVGYEAGPTPIPVSPIVPSAVLFDNANGGNKDWGMTPPFRALGIAACEAAGQELSPSKIHEGKIGAGYGATAGLYAGGLGHAYEVVEGETVESETVNGITVGAVMAANPVGSPYMPNSDVPWAWPYEQGKGGREEFGGKRPAADYQFSLPKDTKLEFLKAAGASTIIGAVIINAPLSQKQLKRLAVMAQDGIALAVQPSHTPLDGDTIFALSTCADDGPKSGEISPIHLAELGAAAARCTARAVMRGIYKARPLGAKV